MTPSFFSLTFSFAFLADKATGWMLMAETLKEKEKKN